MVVTLADLYWYFDVDTATPYEQLQKLRYFMTLPAWKAAPAELKAEVELVLGAEEE